jgi:hypothetical protein
LKAAAKDPGDRYNTPLALAAALEQALNGGTGTISRTVAEKTRTTPADNTVIEPLPHSWDTVQEKDSAGFAPVKEAGVAPARKKIPLWIGAAVLLVACVACVGGLGVMALLQDRGGDDNNNNSVALGTPTPALNDANENSNTNESLETPIIPSLPTMSADNVTPVNMPTLEIPTPAVSGPSGLPTQAVPPEFLGMQVVQSSILGPGNRDQFEFANIFEGGISGAVQPAGDLDLVVEIIDGSGASLLTVDQLAAGGAEVFTFTPPTQAGNYFVVVSEFSGQSGRYSIVLDGTPAIFFVIDPEDSIAGRVEGDNTASFFIQGFSGQTLTVRVTPDNDLDAYIRLFRDQDIVTAVETGVLPDPLAQVDGYVAGGVETLTHTFSLDGIFIIDVAGFEGDAGTFTMTISQ